uniref:Protein kinase domain-containing protein n=1 Tax=Fagus sylvatica TaxID=28930 RepID=A0A2N9GZV7_FAGSY
MVAYNFKIEHFLFPHLSILFYLSTISYFFSLLTSFTSALSFNFTSFSSADSNITYERSAFPENQVIQLTEDKLTLEAVGRATYYKPMHLWDKDSGNLTDFTTHFSFSIDSKNQSVYGDGLAFFLAPLGSKIPMYTKGGSTMGLARDDQAMNSVDNPFVAVEFDIYSNEYWDPPGEHVGIDINSMKSIADMSWYGNIAIMEGKKNEAWIRYNSSSYNLSVVFTGFRYGVPIRQFLSANVDLSRYLPEWVTFGFSATTGNSSAIHTIYSWDFKSSLEIDNSTTNPKDPVADTPSPDLVPNQRKNNTLGLAIGFGIGGLVLVGGLALFLFALWKRNRRDKEEDHVLGENIDEEFERGRGPKKFSYDELAHATNDFNDGEKLGQGGFGAVYKGFLRDSNSFVAVKKVAKGSKQGIKEYSSEVKIISRLRHRNLVQLIGWCHDRREELLLVYEFMSNGSLDSHLYKKESVLIWAVRYKVAQGLASSLLYLHEEWEQCVLHRDIKSSNIMLDSHFNAKLGDFGLARLVDHAKGSQTTCAVGTMGYMAPEYYTNNRASKESDVYSFGIVALEIACGRKAINPVAPRDEVVTVKWVRELHKRGEVLEAADQRLCGNFDTQQMERLIIVGLWCAHPDYNLRPSIRQAIHVLNFEAPLPNLPPDMPETTHLAPTVNRPESSLSALGDAIYSWG